MAHNIKKNTQYKIITVQIAVPNIDTGEVEDGINEILTGALADENSVIIDWQYTVDVDKAPTAISSDEPEEGELFKRIRRRFFTTPFAQTRKYRGRSFEIVRELTDKEIGDKEEVGPVFLIKFDDGTEIQAWPEEIFEQ